jgi:prepilin-type N-terminal cleavage/methylation domain-containing protein
MHGSRHLRRRRARRGFTLIEVLLTLAITVLVVALLYSTYHTVSTISRQQQQRQSGRSARLDVMETLARDLGCAVPPDVDPGCAFTLAPDPDVPGGTAELSFCAMIRPPADNDLRWSEIEWVRYLARPEEDRDGYQLWRVGRSTSGRVDPSLTVTQQVARKLSRFEVRLFDGADWQEKWPAKESAQGTPGSAPAAARLRIQTADSQQPIETEIYIAIGHETKSPLLRQGGPAD